MNEIIAIFRGHITKMKWRILKKNIHVGKKFKIYKHPRISCKGKISIGDNCTISGIAGDAKQCTCLDSLNNESEINIGHNVSLYAARISSKYSISIGSDVLIEESGIIDTDFHSIDKDRSTPIENKKSSIVKIGNCVCIGARSLIIKGVKIGDNALILPGSVVKSSIPENCIVCGNPARRYESSANSYSYTNTRNTSLKII